ncbi:hypothetical protein NE857_33770 (plasmid) [Nocardiopsis exhalans]|uniref:Uncharacterized protein n=1 Tax=Nocardiopsis exhalans TaxID=163604 RepID=A0ABY5DK02_9ACTN|nr:hypothetical protein [Nocardiopsis exhalans]USY23600.1 hypothetical protein NE857_33770 [Nocardiopsis exhalans]
MPMLGTPSPDITITTVMTNGRNHLATYPTGYPTGTHDAVKAARFLAHADGVARVVVAHGPDRYRPNRPAGQICDIPAIRFAPDFNGPRPAPFKVERALREHIHDSYAEAVRVAIIHGDRDRADRMTRARDHAAARYAQAPDPEDAAIREMTDERDYVATLYAQEFNVS